ncbi:MAG: class I SAM-dependent rRNA methyltransferase [Verrucomicrobiae bacterium]|nr:class I SAM-dependent rRNA methyltransferase [Verrucomicrobiae bacterium]MDW7980252.1 class I SAM-dependent rRNA methyltransferase [Verrucomicrobiales bacterium]
MEAKSVILKAGDADRIVAGHPWVYQSSIRETIGTPADGDVVAVKDHRKRFIGIGFYNSKSKIAVRVLAHEPVEINETFFDARIRQALDVRKRHMPDATSFRIVNSESDYLSGLIVDKYEDVLVIQVSALGMEARKRQIVTVLERIFSPRAILERSDISARKFEGLEPTEGLLAGELTGPVNVNINGLVFETDLLKGQKTGLYLDQQINYRLVAELVARLPGATVLDCFSFVGGFALHCARAGAGHVHMLEQSADAVNAAMHNAAINRLAEKCSAETVNVFDWLSAQTKIGKHEKLIPKFDVIVLDPPSFTRNRAAVPNALRGYKEIHLRALKLLRPRGMLITFCCSHHVDAHTFKDTILSAAWDCRKILRQIATFTQGPDHPIIPMIPETEYLKGFAFELIS